MALQRVPGAVEAAVATSADLPLIDNQIRRAHAETAAFQSRLTAFAAVAEKKQAAAETSRRPAHDGQVGFDAVLKRVRSVGISISEEEVRRLFDAADSSGLGRLDPGRLVDVLHGAAGLRTGHAAEADAAALASAARALHAQALSDPLSVVAEGELPTLMRCASSGHTAAEQLGLAALTAVAAAPQANCAAAIVARPTLGGVLASMGRANAPLTTVVHGCRLLAALCQEAGEAREVEMRRRVRLRLYELAAPLMHGAFGERAVAAASSHATAAQAFALALVAFAAEPEIAPRLATDGGGAALQLACSLAADSTDAATRMACVETLCLAADGPHAWRLVGFGALPPLLAAAAIPSRVSEPAELALHRLGYRSLWKGSPHADPLAHAY